MPRQNYLESTWQELPGTMPVKDRHKGSKKEDCDSEKLLNKMVLVIIMPPKNGIYQGW